MVIRSDHNGLAFNDLITLTLVLFSPEDLVTGVTKAWDNIALFI